MSPAKRNASEQIRRLREKIAAAIAGGGSQRQAAQKEKGKLTARERLQHLLDEGSFQERDLLVRTRATDFALQDKSAPGDGVITGIGRIGGKNVCVFAQDFTVLGGSLGLAHAMKICKIMDLAYDSRVPMIGLLDSGGARIQEGVDSLDGYGEIFRRNVRCSGVIPQISVILGPCAGGAVYSPALTDFVFMVEGISSMFVTGPNVVKEATGEEVTFETLGSPAVHASKSGVCHFVAKDELECFRQVRQLLSFLPQNNAEKSPLVATSDPPDRTLPILDLLCAVDQRTAYQARHVIWLLADDNKFLEVHALFAPNIAVGFLRLGGRTVGIVANDPAHLSGALDINSADKAARFVRFLDAFNIGILTLVDVPGYWPGLEQEHGGIIRHGAKLLYAYAEATVAKVTVVMRKAYGGAYVAMGSKHLGGDFNFALPSAEMAVMGPDGAVKILYSREIAAALSPEERKAVKDKLTKEYTEQFATPYEPAAHGSIDEVIEPAEMRCKVVRAFEFLEDKRRPGSQDNHRNIPL